MPVRVRLTLLFGGLFLAFGALLLAVSGWLVDRQLERTLPDAAADEAVGDLVLQYGVTLAGVTLVAGALGWLVADRVLAPLHRITTTAQQVSEERLGERIALGGRRDELRELADTFDSMLDRLQAAFEAQRVFIANASHELRSPLTVIRTEADVALADPDATTDELRAMGEVVLEATDRTDALLDGLMVLARSQRGVLSLQHGDLAAAARAAAAAVAREAQAAGVTVRLACDPAPVHGEWPLLERLVGNLLENAVRYNRPGGLVEVRTGLRPGPDDSAPRPCLQVANTGPVVDPAVVPALLEPFERGGRGSSGGVSGSGLGLSIVRAVAEAHGGSVTLHAQPAGGLVADVVLPRADAPAPLPATGEHAALQA